MRGIIRRAVAAEEHNWKAARNYGFAERVEARRLDAAGRLKSKEVKLYDVTLMEGSPYRRLALRDDRPLPPAEERKEQEKLAGNVAGRRTETPAQRSLRLAEYENRPEWQREAWRCLPEAFDFRIASEETRDGRGTYVIAATPRPGYKPRSRTARALVHLEATLWVDKQDFHLAKAEVRAIETISVGLVLVRLAKGARATFEQTRVNDEVWLPSRVEAFASARLGLLKVLHIEQEIRYSNCREFEMVSSSVARIEAGQSGR